MWVIALFACSRWHVSLLHIKPVSARHKWSLFIPRPHFSWEHGFWTCAINLCLCVFGLLVGWERVRQRGKHKAEIRSLLKVLLEALMEVLLVFSFCLTPPIFTVCIMCVYACVCEWVGVYPEYFFHDKCGPPGLLFSMKTLMWSDRRASGALLWGDLHCGGDPRVWPTVDNNRKRSQKDKACLSLKKRLSLSLLLLFLLLLYFFFPHWFSSHTFLALKHTSEDFVLQHSTEVFFTFIKGPIHHFWDMRAKEIESI